MNDPARQFLVTSNGLETGFADRRFYCQFVNGVEVDYDTARKIGLFAEWHINETDCLVIGMRRVAH
jgi:hypothetical protein